LVAAGFEDGVVRVWDINSEQAIHILRDTVEDIEQVTSTTNHHSAKERVTCLQIVVPTSHYSMPTTPTSERGYSYSTSRSISDQKPAAILLATYQNGYFREWDLDSGQIIHAVNTNQKSARDGSVKCWIRSVYDSEDESDNTSNKQHKSSWKLFYTIPGEFGNAITSVAAKV
ncbi:19411_t:CDS:2, partial [Gigaspora rosea]